MPEQEAQLQATASLSPVSPSPVHSASPLVVPALQNTVDTIDAMVAAAAAHRGCVGQPEATAEASVAATSDNALDDDSFGDAYGEVANVEPISQAKDKSPQPADENDDYAKTFDSPINPPKDAGQNAHQEDVPSETQESNLVPISSDQLNGRPQEAAQVATEPSSPAVQDAPQSAVGQSETASELCAADPAQHAEPQPAFLDTGSAHHLGVEVAPHASNPGEPDAQADDIQQLVADLTAKSAEAVPDPDASESSELLEQPLSSTPLAPALPSASSLPPRPPQPQSGPQTLASLHHPTGATPSVAAQQSAPPASGHASSYVAAGAPGTSTEAINSLPPPPTAGLNAASTMNHMNSSYPVQTPGYHSDLDQEASYERQWEQFMAEERQYMSEAKWDRFPEGSRIFIGNLSSDKVSKREVFDLFHRFGRLAQISLKSAYGFVQYHTVEEGRSAMENLQGMEVKGRRIHLEVSRIQDKSKRDRGRSPDKARGHETRKSDRYGQGRDDYRPGRNQSPRRGDFYGRDRDRNFHEPRRGGRRSRSPSYGHNGRDAYRRRSPSPYGRPRAEPELDLPLRYGADVPDVQIILQPDVSRDFVAWVEGAFKAKGLRTEVMFLHPRMPKDQVIQRQAAEGVHAVVDLDLQAQHTGRVPVQAFDRSAGTSNVRFDRYENLDPGTAAEVILRAKASGAPTYGQAYGAQVGYAAHHAGHPPHTPGAAGPYAGYQQAVMYQGQAQAAPGTNTADLGSLMGQMDNATLQRLLSSIQGAPQAALTGAAPTAGPPAAANATAQTANSQVDIQALLGSLGGSAAGIPQHGAQQQAQYGAAYSGHSGPSGGAAGDSAAQVQNIMAHLARYRQ